MCDMLKVYLVRLRAMVKSCKTEIIQGMIFGKNGNKWN